SSRRAWRSAKSTVSGPPSGPRSRRRAATSPSSGWSSRKSRTRSWTTCLSWRRTSSLRSSGAPSTAAVPSSRRSSAPAPGWRGYGEIIGGSQRIHDHDLLLRRIQEHGLPLEAFRWYLDIRRYGSVPHAGFGMGIERFVSWVAGIHHLREAIPYPRTINRLYP